MIIVNNNSSSDMLSWNVLIEVLICQEIFMPFLLKLHISAFRAAVLSHLKTYNLYYEGQNLQLRHREVCISSLFLSSSFFWVQVSFSGCLSRSPSEVYSSGSCLLSSASQRANPHALPSLGFNRKRGSSSSRACWISSGAYDDQSGCRCRMTTSGSGRHPPLRPGTQVAIWTVKGKLSRRIQFHLSAWKW